jgi:two-component system alkaline phosphatase synthesis response regulator PhoP
VEDRDREYNQEVGRRLRTVRKARGLSLVAVEEATGGEFKPSALGSYERGDRGLSVYRLSRLLGLYGVTPDEVLVEEGAAPAAGTSIAAPGRRAGDGAGGRPVVLVVDDDPAIREIVSTALRLEGYQTMTAADGVMALELLTRSAFDVVVLDAVMPRMDGLTVLRAMRSDPALRAVPVLMLSGLAEVHHLEQSVDAGANGYLTKPFEFRTLLEHLNRLGARSPNGLPSR